ncbi:glycosyltransferase family 2 protein [Terracoccus luteus]|uniref:Glycosyltransferase involved in cell wall biosynthesis n=1 Tax=Terracoccus luteus TaxID=53356 RepID=A0A839PU00_9MICO|nr:glycosyltransferase family 2 protein [Terracoccus luteus]MBB2985466.1 glycosyltransferase involved in cell wall biosynthesis [Terracoccus luteus]MCP2171118.1 glycosyltransferase involved in cell wall biosynthesis [Terracoccus luteus]
MQTPAPLLTVVCNVFDDAERLPRAVASALAGWTTSDIEVVVVDDGSDDETGEVADRLAAADGRVRVIHLDRNDGTPGAARNRGLDAARGEWVAFVDSDDEYLPGALRRLVDRGREQGADVVAGAVARYNERTGQVTPLQATGYTRGAESTGGTDDAEGTGGVLGSLGPDSPLWDDTIAVAKAIRVDLVRRHRLRFPEGILYEDQPFTVALWLGARRVATLDEVVYHWFVNNVEGSESITARRHAIENFHDRLAANREIDALLEAHPDLRAPKLEKFLGHDLALYGKDLDTRDEEYRAAFVTAARGYLLGLPATAREGLPQPLRLLVRELVDGPPDSAVAASLFAYRRRHLERPLARRAGGWWWPYRPASEATADHDLTAFVAALHAGGRRLRTVTATAVRPVGSTLRLAGTVVDGDDSLGHFARVSALVRDRRSKATVGRASTRVRAHGRFEVGLDLPEPDTAPGSVTTWDVKVTFENVLGRRGAPSVAGPLPVEVAASVTPAEPVNGLLPYRTRNGNLSLRTVPAVPVAAPTAQPAAAGTTDAERESGSARPEGTRP